MIAQTLNNIRSTSSFLDFILLTAKTEERAAYSASDFGYTLNEAELIRELEDDFCGSASNQPAPQVEPEDFESAYNWFIS